MKERWLIVGAGLFGAVFAREMKKKGADCTVIDRRDHIAGNIYTEKKNGIHVHCYGAHIFHTSDKEVWEYASQFADFNNFINSPVARYGDEVYNLPFNMNTFAKMFGIASPDEAKKVIEEQRKEITGEPKNLEAGGIPWRSIHLARGPEEERSSFAYTFFNQAGFRTSSHTERIFKDVWDRSILNRHYLVVAIIYILHG